MSLRSFLKLVEIQTKLASQIPLIIGTLYAVYRFDQFRWQPFLLMFFSLLCIDMATTAINNYIDFKKAKKKSGYGYETHNAIVRDKLSEGSVLSVIGVLFAAAVGAGLLLVQQTGLVVLVLGALSFAVGILYSFGPIAISRMPLGEIFSGLFMGFLILFLSAFIHITEPQLITMAYAAGELTVGIRLIEVLLVFAVSIPAVCGIANIMLANNICDMEEDLENGRYTLPVYIGKANAIRLFRAVNIAAFLDVAVLIALGVPWWLALPLLFVLIPVLKNSATFAANPSKAETFPLAVQNFMMMNAARIAVWALALLVHTLF